MQKGKFGLLVRVCKVYFLLFLFGIVLGAGFALGPVIFGQAKEPGSLRAAESKENVVSQGEESQGTDIEDNRDQADLSTKPEVKQTVPQMDSSISSSPLKDNRMTILLVGVDRRPNEKSISNTDTLIVASVDIQNGKVALISVPRDTQITIPGYGMSKINAAARLGHGLKTTSEIIEGLIGQRIEGYVLTNFNGFKEIIDTLGGVTINVEKICITLPGIKQMDSLI